MQQRSFTDKAFGFIGDVFFRLSESIAPGQVLAHEQNQITLQGPKADIRALRAADRKVGKILEAFNGKARLPEDQIDAVRTLVKQALPATYNVAGRKNDQACVLFISYTNKFENEHGLKIEQPIITVRLGKTSWFSDPKIQKVKRFKHLGL